MKTKFLGLAAGAAVLCGLAASPSYAAYTQFADAPSTGLSYSYVYTGHSTPSPSTVVGNITTAVSTTQTETFPAGTAADALFPGGLPVTLTVTANALGPLTYTDIPLTGSQPNGYSNSNPAFVFVVRSLSNISVTDNYAGSLYIYSDGAELAAPATGHGQLLLAPGQELFEATGLDGTLTGNAVVPTYHGALTPTKGVTLSVDETTSGAGVFSDGTGNFFDFTNNVLEDGLTLTSSNTLLKLGCIASTCPAYVDNGGAYHLLSTTSPFYVQGSFSANPSPLVNGVPEPATWALMLLGVGVIGGSMRRRVRLSI